MRMARICGMLCALSMMTACDINGLQPVSNSNAVITAPGDDGNGGAVVSSNAGGGLGNATGVDEQLLFAAETAYNVPAHAYVTADAAGQLSPAIKARVRPILIQAYARLQDARRLYALGNASDFSTAAREAIGLANSAKALLPN